jgi:hypothetical protein
MNHFTITELYEISDALMERRARLLSRRATLAEQGITSDAADRMIESAKQAHMKIEKEILDRAFTLEQA